MTKGVAIKYSEEELEWIKQNSKRPREEARQEFCIKFQRDGISLVSFNALCKRKGWMTGRTGRIQKGDKPWNKDIKGLHLSPDTQFKKGNIPHNAKKVGHERLSKDGYIELNIGRKTKHNQHGFYILKHVYLWELENGKIKEGFCLKCLDGNKANCEPSNWEAINRGVLPFLNGRYDGNNYDLTQAVLRPSLMALAKVKYARSRIKKIPKLF